MNTESQYFSKMCTIENVYPLLFEELSRIGISSYIDYFSCRTQDDASERKKKLIDIELSFARKMRSFADKIEDIVKSANGLVLSITDDPKGKYSKSELNKLIAFSDISFLRCPSIRDEYADYIWTHGFQDMVTHDKVKNRGPDISSCVQKAYKYLPDIRRGLIIPLPQKINYYEPDKSFFTPEDPLPFFGEREMTSDIIITHKSHFELCSHQHLIGSDSKYLKLGIVMPSIEKLPSQTARKLRADYPEDFINFQKALRDLSYEININDNEEGLRILFERTEYEVRRLNKAFKRIKKTHKSLNILTGMVCIIFYISHQKPELMNYLNFLFSGIAGSAVYQFFHMKDEISKIEDSPFYFPLKLIEDSHE